jgi:hypothetical protein
MKGYFLAAFCFYITNFGYSQIGSGCTDRLASNFNWRAVINNGTCRYPSTSLNPENKVTLDPILNETSGLEFLKARIWNINDSGGEAKVYGQDPSTGNIVQEITITDGKNVDWEDLAEDEDYLYVGDFGNNSGNRTDLTIYKIPKPFITQEPKLVLDWNYLGKITFKYEDQIDFTSPGVNKTSYDCEGFFVHEDKIHLFSKDWTKNITTHYTIPTGSGNYVAKKIESFDCEGMITGSDISPAGDIFLVGYTQTGSVFGWLLYDYKDGKYFNGNKRKFSLGSALNVGQVEGVVFRDNSLLTVSAEKFNVGPISVPQNMFQINISNFLPPTLKIATLRKMSLFQENPNAITINWTTTWRDNITKYEIEKARSESDFKTGNFMKIGTILGDLYEKSEKTFSWTDSSEENSGLIAYRIKTINDQGVQEISQPLTFEFPFPKTMNISLSPNPADIFVNLKVELPRYHLSVGQIIQVQIYDLFGNKLLETQRSGDEPIHQMELDLTNFAPGIYLLQVGSGKFQKTEKLVVH